MNLNLSSSMDFATWEAQPQPPPPPLQLQLQLQPPQQMQTQLYPPHHNYPSQPQPPGVVLQNPNPITLHLTATTTQYYAAAEPSNAVSAAAVPSSYIYPQHQQQLAAVSSYEYNPQAAAAASSSGYYYDPNYVLDSAAAAAAIAAAYAVSGEITVPSSETGHFAAGNPNSIPWNNQSFVPQKIGTWKKRQTKAKIVQSAYCEVCKVDCNSKDVFEQHKLGKKHKKNLEKLKETTVPTPSATARSVNPIIGPQENPQKVKAEEARKSKKKKAQGVEDLETKRRKVVEGGAAMEAVRTCTICNVVCNSDTVFSYHLAGQKHLAMVKKRAAGRS